MKSEDYFYIKDHDQIGVIRVGIEPTGPYLYGENGWYIDRNHIITDREIGYDGEVIGATDMLILIDRITKEEAAKMVKERFGEDAEI